MKAIATGAFVLMALVYFFTLPLGSRTLLWVVRWDHVNAFAEASMIGALADWFAVVALFKHPLGIPIWHTAIVPRKKDEIGRNIGTFVEEHLLSIENLAAEIGRFSPSRAAISFLASPEDERRAAGWVTDAVRAMVQALDDEEVDGILAELVTARLRALDAAAIVGSGLEILAASGRQQELIDQALRRVAEWLPSRRETIQQFIERSLERTLKWGSRLIPDALVQRATDQTLTALTEVLHEAAADPRHPLRADFTTYFEGWIVKLRTEPEWIARAEAWKNELIDHPELRRQTATLWSDAKAWILADTASAESVIRRHALRVVRSAHGKLASDPELARVLDDRLRAAAVAFLASHHHAIGALIQRVVDGWDSKQLSRDLELALGPDLQYIRLNGTFIGGLVGLGIHLLS